MTSNVRVARWLPQRTFEVLVLDGTDRLTAFPRLMVFPVEKGEWGACVAAAAGRHQRLPLAAPTVEEAKRACLGAARSVLPPRWYQVIDGALAALTAGSSVRPSRAVASPVTAASRHFA